MITLSTILIIWFIISIYRIYKKTGSWREWNPYEATAFDYIGVLIGGAMLLVVLFIVIITFLP
jgi:hypothetical protein